MLHVQTVCLAYIPHVQALEQSLLCAASTHPAALVVVVEGHRQHRLGQLLGAVVRVLVVMRVVVVPVWVAIKTVSRLAVLSPIWDCFTVIAGLLATAVVWVVPFKVVPLVSISLECRS
jgi:nitrate reductase NapAB chaperone NapD